MARGVDAFVHLQDATAPLPKAGVRPGAPMSRIPVATEQAGNTIPESLDLALLKSFSDVPRGILRTLNAYISEQLYLHLETELYGRQNGS